MLTRSILAWGVATLISLLITPYVINLAHRIGAIDLPNERKIHHTPIPRLGGIVLIISFLLSFGALFALDPWLFKHTWIISEKGLMFLVSLLLVFFLGMWDDLRSLSPVQKFVVQVVAASLCYFSGFTISSVTNPFGNDGLDLGMLEFPLTVLWIVGVTNAFNLIDGLDGLASGTGMIASLSMFSILLLNQELATALVALMFGGALFGFLRYNFNPAKIFLGDSGSLLTGFTLAILSIEGSTKGTTAFAILVPIFALGLPIIETFMSMIRRFLGSFLPDQKAGDSFIRKLASMFYPDKKHIHHQLISLGLSHRRTVITLYLVSAVFGFVAFSVTVVNSFNASLILLAVGVATIAGVRQLRYREMAIVRNGVLLPLYDWPVLHRSIFQGFLDLAFCSAAFVLAFLLTPGQESSDNLRQQLLSHLPIICGVQISVFYAAGLYRGTLHYLGIGDVLRIVRTVAIAVICSSVALVFLTTMHTSSNVFLAIVDFYILLTLVAGSRVSFRVLHYLFRKETKAGKNVIIYGAGLNGMLTLQRLLDDDTLELRPIGFLDDNPQLEGKRVNGYAVFGGHWKLARLLKKYPVHAILIASNPIYPEILHRIKRVADTNGIVLKKQKMVLENVSIQSKPTRRLPLQSGSPSVSDNGQSKSGSALQLTDMRESDEPVPQGQRNSE